MLAAPARADEDDGWVIDSFDVTVDILPDGSLEVVEEIQVDFGDLERRGIFRVIPTHYALGQDDTQVQLPHDRTVTDFDRVIEVGDVTVTSTAPDEVELNDLGRALRLRIGDEDVEVSGEQSYRISYTVTGALNSYQGFDELYWNATGDDWPAPISRATAIVNAPEVSDTACYVGTQGSPSFCADNELSADQAQFTATTLSEGQGLTVAVALPPDAVEVAPPLLEERYSLQRALVGSPLAWPLAALTTLLGLGAVGLLAYRQGRDRVARGGVTVDGRPDQPGPGTRPQRRSLLARREVPVGFRPPEDLRPAQLGLIVDERVEGVEVSATIVDLAVRGHLTIAEVADEKDWRLDEVKDAPRDELLPYERKLLDGLFETSGSVRLGKLKGTFSERYAEVQQLVYSDGVARGWFPRSPKSTRTVWLLVGVGALAITCVVGFLLMRFSEVGVAAVPLVLAALVLVVAHGWMPHRTPKGSRLLNDTLGFAEFIRTAEADRMAFAEEERIFERYLPYAIVFGAVDQWAAAFAGLGAAGAAAVGGWYVGYGAHPDLGAMAHGLSSFSHQLGTAVSTAPASSGSGGAGFSGGGFGGGGGGSW